jgi:hypothetical protein
MSSTRRIETSAAASSMASGIPSSRRQMLAMSASAASSGSKPGRADVAR